MGEVFVDARKGLVELGARNLVDLLDRLLRIFDGLDQILALRFEEAMALRCLLVLIERHHVDRAHLLDALAQRAAGFFFGGEGFVDQSLDVQVGAQICGFDIDFGQATGFKMLKIGAQLGHRGGANRAIFAQLVERGAIGFQLRFDSQAAAATPGTQWQWLRARPIASARMSASSFWRAAKGCVLLHALLALGFRARARLFDGHDAALQVGVEPIDALEGSFGSAAALFKAGQFSGYLSGLLLQPFALLRS